MKFDGTKDYYKLLGISYTASDNEIVSAYRKKVRLYHPDLNKSFHSKLLTEVIEAYKILIDPNKRFEYNIKLISFYENERKFKNKDLLRKIIKLVRILSDKFSKR